MTKVVYSRQTGARQYRFPPSLIGRQYLFRAIDRIPPTKESYRQSSTILEPAATLLSGPHGSGRILSQLSRSTRYFQLPSVMTLVSSLATEFTESKQASEETAMRVTRDALAGVLPQRLLD